MGRKSHFRLVSIYILILAVLISIGFGSNKMVTVLSESAPVRERKTVVIDPGHGGEDGGAVSCTGVLESQINLQISQRLNDLMHLLGIHTVMIRNTDASVCTEGNTIAARKVSDLKKRVQVVQMTENALVVSIHQNHFSDSKYSGAQVFYAPTEGSRELATKLQECIVTVLNPGSNRNVKPAESIYLMQHISCVGILVECGFLSNYEEEAKLRDADYQKKVCGVIACNVSGYLNDKVIT